MRKLIFLILLIPSAAFADVTRSTEWTEVDASPSVYNPYKIKVSNGSLTDNADGTITVTTSGGSVAGSDLDVQYNDAGSFAGEGRLRWYKGTNTLVISRDSGQTGEAIRISSDTGVSLAAISHDGSASFAGLTLSPALTVPNGGTGLSSGTANELVRFATSTTIGTTSGMSWDSSNLRLHIGPGTGPMSMDVGGSFGTVPVVLTDAATIATDASRSNQFFVTLGGNRTLGQPTNPTHGQKCIWVVSQDATGSRTLAYHSVFRFGTSVTSPTLSTTAGMQDYIGAVYNIRGTRAKDMSWDVVAVSLGYPT